MNDWTEGKPGLVYERCEACGKAWYFRRGFCPGCGVTAVRLLQASGRGTVHALTTVQRAPSEALRAEVPYDIALVDADEGFRLMARAAPGLRIGDTVSMGFISSQGQLLPRCEKHSDA